MRRPSSLSTSKGALVSHRCHLQMLELINDKLDDVNKQRLFSSQFGVLFPFPTLQFQGQMFNVLLRHLEGTSMQRNRLEFYIGGRKLEFGPRDFAMITGLRFDGYFEQPSESETHRILFKKRQSISVDDIANAFSVECRESGGRSPNALRLACLLIVFGVFVTMGGSVNHVDMNFFHLIDDVDAYLLFPWGKVAYDSLVKRTHRARNVLEKQMMLQKKITLDANCFVLALQVWAYEIIPIVGRNCAYKDPGTEHLFPRLRRWTASMSIKYDVLHAYFSNLSAETLTPMIPTDTENQRLAEIGVSGMSTRLKRGNKVINHPEVNKVDKEKEDVNGDLRSRVAALEQELHSLKSLFETYFFKDMKIDKRLINYTTTKGDMQLSLPQKRAKLSESATLANCKRCGLRSQTGLSANSSIKSDNGVPKPVLNVPGKSSNATDLNKKNTLYDPNERDVEVGCAEEFNAWRAKSQKGSSGLRIPFRMVDVVSSEWFDNLWSRHGWLNTVQMDALINLLIVTSKQEPELFGYGWTVLEMRCWDALCSTNQQVVMDGVGQYVVGLHPQTNPLHWAFASHVYGVGNVGGDHWVSYDIALDERCITVFDSRSESSQWESVEKVFRVVCKNVQDLCDLCHVWRIKGSPVDNEKKWKVVRFKHPPQQPNNYDCGIMAIKYIECLVSGNPVSVLDSSRCGFFRKAYCLKLFKAGKLEAPIQLQKIS